ncbi:serine protease FAM111A-like [Alosa sapidissima]|uniref:serine protease FAM111A-like n=1 Tax=Alosa sapidissima TaxID=34773 RepID=UPI001C09CBBC|nr:serine protease FAM111A-like [Alosa sapidissima]
MPPKKKQNAGHQGRAKDQDIRSFLKKSNGPDCSSRSTQPDGARASQNVPPSPEKVKEENSHAFMDQHSHYFTVKFSPTDLSEYTIDCDQPNTVLEAIKSNKKSKEMITCADENIIIQLGKGDRESIVATHFLCSCIRNGECLTISCKSESVEKAQNQHDKNIYPTDKYSVFYIDTVGGIHTRTKELFRNNTVKQFKFLCVYGKKGMTVEEALRIDGRFIDNLGNFRLSNNENPKQYTVHTQKVVNLNEKKFKICLPKRKSDEHNSHEKNARNPSPNSQSMRKPRSVTDVAHQSGVSVKTAVEKSGIDTEEIYERLRQHFPDLKEWMESRFPGNSYQEALDLRKENFGKSPTVF